MRTPIARCVSEAEGRELMSIHSIHKEGLTVRKLIWELQKFPPDMKVTLYGRNGSMYDVIKAIQDGKKVALF